MRREGFCAGAQPLGKQMTTRRNDEYLWHQVEYARREAGDSIHRRVRTRTGGRSNGFGVPRQRAVEGSRGNAIDDCGIQVLDRGCALCRWQDGAIRIKSSTWSHAKRKIRHAVLHDRTCRGVVAGWSARHGNGSGPIQVAACKKHRRGSLNYPQKCRAPRAPPALHNYALHPLPPLAPKFYKPNARRHWHRPTAVPCLRWKSRSNRDRTPSVSRFHDPMARPTAHPHERASRDSTNTKKVAARAMGYQAMKRSQSPTKEIAECDRRGMVANRTR